MNGKIMKVKDASRWFYRMNSPTCSYLTNENFCFAVLGIKDFSRFFINFEANKKSPVYSLLKS